LDSIRPVSLIGGPLAAANLTRLAADPFPSMTAELQVYYQTDKLNGVYNLAVRVKVPNSKFCILKADVFALWNAHL
jgi:hypothetical protein